mgnify:CR=1 FL=1
MEITICRIWFLREEEPTYGKIWNVTKAVLKRNTDQQGISICY